VLREEITPALRLAVKRGLAHLIREQKLTASFRNAKYPVAVNALTGLAILAGGNSELSGPEEYAESLNTITDTLLAYQTKSGYFDDSDSVMYGHGFATLFLAELYGMSRRRNREVRDALRRAVHLIEVSQSREGGWDYNPGVELPGGSVVELGNGDTSITVCETLALRAARNLGISVSDSVVMRAQKFIRSCQNSDGGFRYRLRGPYNMADSALPRSAAGVCILYSLGDYNSPEIRRGIEFLVAHYTKTNNFPYYAQFYCAQALFQVGGDRWREYFRWVRDELLRRQKADGSWPSGTLEHSSLQRTAMALIILQLPYRFLPIHER
jgi:hypothetical protein